MSLFEWRSELLLHIPEIDRQHQELVARAGELHNAMSLAAPKPQLQILLSALILCAENHFRSEEELMLAQGYEGRAEHASRHAQLLEQVYIVREEVSSGKIGVCQPLLLFVQVWTEQHILQQDSEFAAFLKTKDPGGEVAAAS
jgi:hemerythrin